MSHEPEILSDADFLKCAEDSIRKKYHKQLFSPFARACKTYELIKDGDHIAVCVSGGSDSLLMAKLFQEIRRHRQAEFELSFLTLDPGFTEEERASVEKNTRLLNIPLTMITVSPEERLEDALYEKARTLSANKIALGNTYNDVTRTILMGMLEKGVIENMMPKLRSESFPGMELIRPLYYVREEDIIKWQKYNALSTIPKKEVPDTAGLDFHALMDELLESNPYVESNIFKSMENVNLDTLIAYKKDSISHHFLDEYDE